MNTVDILSIQEWIENSFFSFKIHFINFFILSFLYLLKLAETP
jgi:hypothetical protein